MRIWRNVFGVKTRTYKYCVRYLFFFVFLQSCQMFPICLSLKTWNKILLFIILCCVCCKKSVQINKLGYIFDWVDKNSKTDVLLSRCISHSQYVSIVILGQTNQIDYIHWTNFADVCTQKIKPWSFSLLNTEHGHGYNKMKQNKNKTKNNTTILCVCESAQKRVSSKSRLICERFNTNISVLVSCISDFW